MSAKKFCYTNPSINPILICKICHEPLYDPVTVPPDENRYCRSCVVDRYESSSPELIKRLVSVHDVTLRGILGSLKVQCTDCGQNEINRKDIDQHHQYSCRKRIVRCKAADLRCSWTGEAENFRNHLTQCPFEPLRAALQPALAYPNELVELKSQLETSEKQRIKLEKMFKALLEVSQRQSSKIDDLQKKLHEQIENQTKFQLECEERFKHVADEQPKEVPRPVEQRVNIDDQRYSSLKQLCDKHEVQIGLISKKKIFLPDSNGNSDLRLSDYLLNLRSESQLIIEGQTVTNDDMHYICRRKLQNNRCESLRLEKCRVSTESITIFAEALNDNRFLQELDLINNHLSDLSVHPLALALATSNSTLTWLNLQGNELTDDTANYLADMLKVNRRIKLLNLAENKISDTGIRWLAQTMANNNRTLEVLSISSNPLITDVSVVDLIEMMKQGSTLKLLSIRDCQISAAPRKRFMSYSNEKTGFSLDI